MDSRVRNKLELLVHASAPSRGADDNRYRALASAYLGFEAVSCRNISPQEQSLLPSTDANHSVDGDTTHVDVIDKSHDEPWPAAQAELDGNCSPGPDAILSDEDESYKSSQSRVGPPARKTYLTRSFLRRSLESPQASFSSVLDNADSPILHTVSHIVRMPSPDPDTRSDYGSWQTPPSVVMDSQSTYNRAIPEYSTPTRILEAYLQQFDSTVSGSPSYNDQDGSEDIQVERSAELDRSSPVLPAAPGAKASVPLMGNSERANASSGFLEAQEISTDQVPDTTLASVIPGTPALIRPQSVPITSSNEPVHTPLLRSSTSEPLISTDPLPSSLFKRKWSAIATPQDDHNSTPPASINLPSSSLPEVPSSTSGLVSSSPLPPVFKRPRTNTRFANTSRIYAPPPVTSKMTISLSSNLVTAELSFLATQLDLPARYKISHQARPLRPLERGYWLIPASTWPPDARTRSWLDLRDFVGNGRAGWGVWCVRDGDTSIGKGKGREGDWRVYCWGGVVEYIWLLVYLVSHRRLKKSGAKWFDADEEAVIVMP